MEALTRLEGEEDVPSNKPSNSCRCRRDIRWNFHGYCYQIRCSNLALTSSADRGVSEIPAYLWQKSINATTPWVAGSDAGSDQRGRSRWRGTEPKVSDPNPLQPQSGGGVPGVRLPSVASPPAIEPIGVPIRCRIHLPPRKKKKKQSRIPNQNTSISYLLGGGKRV